MRLAKKAALVAVAALVLGTGAVMAQPPTPTEAFQRYEWRCTNVWRPETCRVVLVEYCFNWWIGRWERC